MAKKKIAYEVKSNGHISISYDDFDLLCDKIGELDMKADEYMPEPEEFREIENNFAEFFKLLLWIDATGDATEENKETRRRIKNIINNNIDFID